MKKFLMFVFLMLLSTSAFAGTYTDQFRYGDAFASKTSEIPKKSQTRFDYSGTTSGYPIYTGYAAPGVASSAAAWRICKATDSSNGPTVIQCVDDGTWDNRASETYA